MAFNIAWSMAGLIHSSTRIQGSLFGSKRRGTVERGGEEEQWSGAGQSVGNRRGRGPPASEGVG